MKFEAAGRGRVQRVFYPLFVFAVNAWVVWRLFFTEFADQLRSVEGEFIALDTYIRHHWPGYEWFPLWNAGYPFMRAYQPAAHYSVAALSAVTGWSVPSAFHFLAALAYSLGGVTFYYLAKALSNSRNVALAGALIFSLFSPSLLLLPLVRADAGGLWSARRLQAMVVYGEFPNITGLMLGMLALALLHRALDMRDRPFRSVAAALAVAAVVATNWPATVALALGLACYIAALSWVQLRGSMLRLTLMGAMACGFAYPFALPSTIAATFLNANGMSGQPTAGAPRFISAGLLALCFAIVRALLARTSFRIRFAALYTLVLGWVVMGTAWFNVMILPQAMRFHVAMEIALILLAILLAQQLCLRSPSLKRPLAVVLVLFCCMQLYHYRRASHRMVHALDAKKTLEFEEATWFDRNMHGARVLAPGTVQFWMNVFTETPQMTGCCEQSVLFHQNIIAGYITQAGYHTDVESGKYGLLWMKAYAVQAVSLGGRNSREGYRDNQEFPARYSGLLPLVWKKDDDYIFRVPERTDGLARVVEASDVVKRPPENGVDAGQLSAFVTGLDNPSLPLARMQWVGPNALNMEADMLPSQVLSVAVDYHSGWTADANGRPVPLHADGLGLIAIEPHCSGPCSVAMHWDAGLEAKIALPLAMLTLIGSLVWCRITRR